MKSTLFRLFGLLKFLLPIVYIVGAVIVWLQFSQSNPDGLANLGIVIYTFPIVAIGTFLFHLDFPYVPGGYYEAHALYFLPSVTVLAVVLFSIFHGLQRLVRPSLAHQSRETG